MSTIQIVMDLLTSVTMLLQPSPVLFISNIGLSSCPSFLWDCESGEGSGHTSSALPIHHKGNGSTAQAAGCSNNMTNIRLKIFHPKIFTHEWNVTTTKPKPPCFAVCLVWIGIFSVLYRRGFLSPHFIFCGRLAVFIPLTCSPRAGMF